MKKSKLSLNSICVFCGSNSGNSPIFTKLAENLGEQIGNRNAKLIYGGGSGLMEIMASSVLRTGGEVVGIIPKKLYDLSDINKKITNLHIVDDMNDRKKMMINLSDAFVSIPGGIGTLDEILEILSSKQLGYHAKPLILLNYENYWSPLIDLFNSLIDHGFIKENIHSLYKTVDSVDEIFSNLNNVI